ncbi:MAG TPA: hypothetical protein VH092_14810 [Urbifossiella sp.]|nr:hypothetical protein [Urbifossiella sp.]
MPKAIFTAASRDRFVAGLPASATFVATSAGEDQYSIGDCRVTCRYRTAPGDFVSRQVLGCHNALRTGQPACGEREVALDLVAKVNTVIGIVGPDAAVEEIATTLAKLLRGVVVSESGAIVTA